MSEESEVRYVWVIESGEYSDYHVVGVFSTEENAKELAARFGYAEDTIARWELDPVIQHLHAGRSLFLVTMLRDGTTVKAEQTKGSRIEETSFFLYLGRGAKQGKLNARVWARDLEGAVKATNEHRAMMIANGEWEE